MEKIKSLGWVIFTLCFISITTGCTTFTPSKEVFTGKNNFNTRVYDAPVETCWLAVKQVLLKNNFSILSEDSQLKQIQGTKNFDKGALSVAVVTQFTLQNENNKTQIYLNATQITKKIHTAKRITHLLIIPIPVGTESSQTQTEGTIEDKKFYDTFFDQISTELARLIQK